MQSLNEYQSQCLIETLNEHATVAITNFDGEMLYVNQKFCNISGYSESELLGKNPRILNSSYHQPSYFKNLWLSIKSGKTWQGEIRNKKKDGSIYFTFTTIVPFLSTEQKETRFIAILNDISDRVFAEKSTKHINGILQTIIEASPFAIIGLETSWKVKIWNESARKIFGVDRHEILGRNFLEYFKDYPALKNMLDQGISKMFDSNFECDIHMMSKDLNFSFASLDYSMIEEDQGILLMIKDVSSQRNMEREILSISDHEQLRIGHDLHDTLGQDLTAIQLKLKLVQNQIKTQAPNLVKEIESLALDFKKANRFVSDFAETLGPVKIENLGLIYVLNNFTESILLSFKIPCKFECNFTPVFSQEVSIQLYRIVTEACMNAVKYSKASKILVQLTKNQGLILLKIKDNGVGFDHQKSNGMGLHIMKYRANAIQASLTISSSESGSTVAVSMAIL
ncbi:MAG: PAS domain S-box protein [Candidatus Cloacimonetes bacterium]|nr:PAS domain S-box protein [Candidatus Cloacimonadota bacterium]